MNLIDQHLNHKHALYMTKVDTIGSVFGGISGIIKGFFTGKLAIAGLFSMITFAQAFDTLLIGGLGALGGLLVTKTGAWALGLFKKFTRKKII